MADQGGNAGIGNDNGGVTQGGNGGNGNGQNGGNAGNGNGQNGGNAGNGNGQNGGNAGNGNGQNEGNGNGQNGGNDQNGGNGQNGDTNGNGNNQNGGDGNNGGSSSSTLDIPATAAAGALSVTLPPMTTTKFYKLAPSEFVTFAWSLSDVIATPTSLTIHAIADNGNTYPVGPTDGIIAGTETSVVWDPYKWNQENPSLRLVPATYRLDIWDDRGAGAARRGGYMQEFNGLKFAFYTPEAYTPLASGWSCTGCNAGSRLAAPPITIALLTTFFVVLLSGFTLLRGRR